MNLTVRTCMLEKDQERRTSTAADTPCDALLLFFVCRVLSLTVWWGCLWFFRLCAAGLLVFGLSFGFAAAVVVTGGAVGPRGCVGGQRLLLALVDGFVVLFLLEFLASAGRGGGSDARNRGSVAWRLVRVWRFGGAGRHGGGRASA